MENEVLKKELRNYIKKENGIDSLFGRIVISDLNTLGEGGNGLVFKCKLNCQEMAIKFLVTDNKEKRERFLAEYFNINYFRPELKSIANMIAYGELTTTIEKSISFPYIIMTKYKESLKKYRQRSELSFNDVIKLFTELCISVKSLHDHNILHRDIKPENILLDDNGKFYLADFGICAFDESNSPIDYKTKEASRMANISFSAPEQIDHSSITTKASDIYSIGQVVFWFVFNRLTKGVDDSKISDIFSNEYEAIIMDRIISKCLMNKPEQRFQSVDEIIEYWKIEKEEQKRINPFDDMEKFQDAIIDIYPECYEKICCVEDQKMIQSILESIMTPIYDKNLWFNNGTLNNSILLIERENGENYLINQSLHTIKKIWCYTSPTLYNDLILIERTTPKPISINGEDYTLVLKVDGEYYPGDTLNSGRIRLKDGTVKKLSELSNIREIYIDSRFQDYIVIAPQSNLFNYFKNDNLLKDLNSSDISKEAIIKVINSLEISYEISMYN